MIFALFSFIIRLYYKNIIRSSFLVYAGFVYIKDIIKFIFFTKLLYYLYVAYSPVRAYEVCIRKEYQALA